MPLLIEIGSQAFIFQKEADAMKVMAALSSAVQVEWDYKGKYSDNRNRYYPDDNPYEISMKTVTLDQLVKCAQAKLPRAQLQIEG
jgi:hypothetical protein